MTPSLPTLSITSAMISPTSGSAAEIAATAAIWSRVFTGRDCLLISSTMTSTAFSRPCLRIIGLAPALTFLRPSATIAWPSTTAVVVPSPATSSVLVATSLRSWAPMFSKGSSSSMSRAIVTPSLVIVGDPTRADRQDRSLLGLLLCGIRDDDAALGHLLVRTGLDDYAVAQRVDLGLGQTSRCGRGGGMFRPACGALGRCGCGQHGFPP